MDTIGGGNPYVAENLHRQRLMLEERQRQKRIASGGIRQGMHQARFDGGSLNLSSLSNTPPLIDFTSPQPPLPNSSLILSGGTPGTRGSGTPNDSRPPYFDNPMSPFSDESDAGGDRKDAPARLKTPTERDESVGRGSCDEGGDDAPVGNAGSRRDSVIEEHTLPCMPAPNFEDIMNHVESFVRKPAEKDICYRCVITRDKRGVDKNMYPTYYLHLERDNNRKIFLLAARKRKKSKTANYLLSTDATDLRKSDNGSYVGKVRCNALGTVFTVYDNGDNPKKPRHSGTIRAELASVIYDPNVLGFRGPRKMTIVIPGMQAGGKADDDNIVRPIAIKPVVEKDTIYERFKNNRYRNDELVRLVNKPPVWSEDSQSFVLNFHGRVTQASVKNFQIIHENDEEYVVMQFGRISNEAFSMDFRYPLSATQAFAIAMTSFHGKLACE